MKTKIIVIVGPTAVGKTALSIEVAKRFNGQIISGDSQQVYRGLDIGTAKIRPEEQEGIPHHLLDVREVGESYSAYDFVTEAAQAIRDIAAQGQLPIICGGTGLYIQSLLEGYHLGGSVPHEEILSYRAQLDSWSDVWENSRAGYRDSPAESAQGYEGARDCSVRRATRKQSSRL